MKRTAKKTCSLASVALAIAALCASSPALAQGAGQYPQEQALKSIINPHNQISDEGYVLWGVCQTCHKTIPDPAKDKSINDVRLHFEEDLTQVCYRCHVVKMHPAGDTQDPLLSEIARTSVPNHMTVPDKKVNTNIRIIQKELPVNLPLEPSTGRIICATCHNPHERGLLQGKNDFGADSPARLRSVGLDVCQYCHRK